MRQTQQKSSAFSSAEMLRGLDGKSVDPYQTAPKGTVCSGSTLGKRVDPYQTAPKGAVCSGSTLLLVYLNSPVMLGNYLQQTTSADNIFRCIFFLAL